MSFLSRSRIALPGSPEWIADISRRPTGGNAQDDDFPGTSLDGKWTKVEPSGALNESVANGHLTLATNNTTSPHMACLLQAISPLSAPVTIEIAMRWHAHPTNYFLVGPVFTAAVTTSAYTWFAPYYLSAAPYSYLEVRYAASFTAAPSVSGTSKAFLFGTGTCFYRATWHGTNSYTFEFCLDGKNWWQFGNTNPRAGHGPNPPTYMGIGSATLGTSPGAQAVIDYFRVY